ncbi:MAG: hypothetical protein PCFJNLEI_02182 [Verrucomicrobiae bacterium]|nr:hypothetical protein [Verrucomicrobiae bacterium]
MIRTLRIDPELAHAGRPIQGLGVQADPPPFLFRHTTQLNEADLDEITAHAERRLTLLRPGIARLFCFPELTNTDRLVRMVRFLDTLGCGVNLTLLTAGHTPRAQLPALAERVVDFVAELRAANGCRSVCWLTLGNEPETQFPHDSPLTREIFGADRVTQRALDWADYVNFNRAALARLATRGLANDVRLVVVDAAWGGQMRRERMALGAAAFPTEPVGFSYHHYNPEDPAFYRGAPPAFAYQGMAEEAARFRRLVGDRELVIWEFNNAGKGFGTHEPGTNARGENVIDAVEAGAELSWKVITALAHGVDGLCLWHMHDSDVNHFGLWRWREGQYRCKPIWFYYAALCRLFQPGQIVVPVTGGDSSVAAVATRAATGECRLAVVNCAPTPTGVWVELPVAADWQQQRIAPPGLAERDETQVTHGTPVTSAEFELAPWELVTFSSSSRR